MKKVIKYYCIALLLVISTRVEAKNFQVVSPDGRLKIEVSVDKQLAYTVCYDKRCVIEPSRIAMTINDGTVLGDNEKLISTKTRIVKGNIPLVYGKNKSMEEHFNEIELLFSKKFSLILRAYNEGVAYRLVTAMDGDVIVKSECAEFNLVETAASWFPQADNEMISWERVYNYYDNIDQIPSEAFSVTPCMFSYPNRNDLRVVIAEADLSDYPGLYLQPDGKNRFIGKWAHYPKQVTKPYDMYAYHRVTERYDYIARTTGMRNYPWRVVIVTNDDKSLLNNELIFKLSREQVLTNTDWITTGKSVWEWWHEAIMEGVPSSGVLSYDTYKIYIDYAAKHKLEFLTIDAGWGEDYIREVCAYAAKNGVKVILWDFINLPVVNPERLTQLKEFGAAGVKVDLIERDDQVAMNWIENLIKDCADRELLLVLHGCPKPTGLQRAYPHIVNIEAVRGAECNKWDNGSSADYHLQFPFIRMLAGPIDYTPGSMRNKHYDEFEPIGRGVPMSMGTRAHELAMYVMIDQPLAYLCDSPVEYNKYDDISEFFSAVPTVWDRTLPLDAKVGQWAVLARNKGNEWYVSVMTNNEARKLTVDFSFLSNGKQYEATIFSDVEATESDATEYGCQKRRIVSNDKITFNLARDGGAVIRLTEVP